MTQEPDTGGAQDTEAPSTAAWSLLATTAAQATTRNALTVLAAQLAHLHENSDALTRRQVEAAATLGAMQDAIGEAFTTAVEKMGREFARLKHQDDGRQEQTGRRITSASQMLAQHIDEAKAAVEALSDDGSEHAKLTGEVLAKVSTLPEAIFDYAESTREQLTATMAVARGTTTAVESAGADIRALEHGLSVVIGSIRDQLVSLLTDYAGSAREDSARQDRHAEETIGILQGLALSSSTHAAELTALSTDTTHAVRSIAETKAAVLDAVGATGEEGRRTTLDIEHRLSAAVGLLAERTDSALSSIAGDVATLAGEFDAFASEAATRDAVQSLREDVAALSDLLASTTEDFTGQVTTAVQEIAAMRAAWSTESAQLMQALERVGRAFLEKASSSEYARDQAVIELGRRVARLELDKPQATIVAT